MLLLLQSLSFLSFAGAITLDSSAASHVYEGNGGLSAGASSRLLWDYPLAQQQDVLDMLFKPQWGLSLHTLKVEIGGDSQSTDGTEPSHEHFRGDLSCGRGYELFLLKEAKLRNPQIQTYGLSWGAPGWINNGTFFGPEMWKYQTDWLSCIRSELGFDIDVLGVYNERYWGGVEYIIGLRAALNAAGFEQTRISIPDGGYDAAIMAAAASNSTFNASFDIIGLHYPCDVVHPEVQEGGKSYWASEDWWDQPTWTGAQAWGHLLNQNYVRMNMTATIAWSPLWSVYSNLEDQAAGLILASEPWSGYWEVSAPIWTGAQWCQFTAPGWLFLSVSSGGSGYLPGGGTYVTLISPSVMPHAQSESGSSSNSSAGASNSYLGLTLIIETFASSDRCPAQNPPKAPQTVSFTIQGENMPPPGTQLFVWQTNETDLFIQQPPITLDGTGSFSLMVPVSTMITVTTQSGGRKGVPSAPIPPSGPFPLPFSDSFEDYAYDAMAHYFSDQYGSFAVRDGSLVQVVPESPGANEWSCNADPITLVGSVEWTDVSVSVAVQVVAAAAASSTTGLSVVNDEEEEEDVSPLNSQTGATATVFPCDSKAPEQVWVWDVPAQGYLSNAASGSNAQQCLNAYGCTGKAVYWDCITGGGTCCGPSCYQGLQWTLTEGGQLVSSLPPSIGCLTASAAPAFALSISPCLPAPSAANQTWAYSPSTGLLELAGTGRCLSQPPPPPTYAQVCGRIASFVAFHCPSPPPGYCLSFASLNGIWALTNGGGKLAGGVITPLPSPGAFLNLTLAMVGTNITAFADGRVLASVIDGMHSMGMAALGSSFQGGATFQDFSVVAAGA